MKPKRFEIRFDGFKIDIEITNTNTGAGSIVFSNVTEKLAGVNHDAYNTRDNWQLIQLGTAINVFECLILAHACAGIEVDGYSYVQGLKTAIDAIGNHYA